MDPVGPLLAADEVQEIEQPGGEFQLAPGLPRRLKNPSLVPDPLAHQNADGLPRRERPQVFVPRDADPPPRLVRQRTLGIGDAVVVRPIAVVDDQHILIGAFDVAQAVVLAVQVGVDGKVRKLRRPDLVTHLLQRLLQPAAQVLQVEAGRAEEDALRHGSIVLGSKTDAENFRQGFGAWPQSQRVILCPGATKPHVVVAVPRVYEVAKRAGGAATMVAPRAAPKHTVFFLLRPQAVGPFPDIPGHVLRAVG